MISIVTLAAVVSAALACNVQDQPDITVSAVTEDVYVLVCGSMNSTAIATAEGIVVIDTFETPEQARAARALIEGLGRGPVRYVINTHHHGDHVFGNQAYSDLPIIAHAEAARAIVDSRPNAEWASQIAEDHPGFVLTLPNALYEGDGMKIVLGGKTLVLKHFRRAHSFSDTVVFSASDGVLVCADLVFNEMINFWTGECGIDVDNWIAALDELSRWQGVDYVVPGHGAVGGAEIIRARREYLADLRETVVGAMQRGSSLEEAMDRMLAALAEYSSLAGAGRNLRNNIEIAWQIYADKQRTPGQ